MEEEKIKELIDERIEEKIEQKVEQKAGKEEKEPETGLDRLIDEKLSEKYGEMEEKEETGMVERIRDEKLSRRSFLKALGIGAGGMALASPVSGAWAQWIASSQGTSDIDADTVDGKHASELGGGVNEGFSKPAKTVTGGATTSNESSTSVTWTATTTTAYGSGTGLFYLKIGVFASTLDSARGYIKKNNNTTIISTKNNYTDSAGNNTTSYSQTTTTLTFTSNDSFTWQCHVSSATQNNYQKIKYSVKAATY